MAIEDEYAYLKNAHITDFEQINALSRTTETKIVQLDDGPFSSDIIKFKAGGVLVSRTTSNRRLRVAGKAQYFNITYLKCPRDHAIWNGTTVGKNQIVFANANEAFNLVTPPRTTTMCIALVAKAHTRLLADINQSTEARLNNSGDSISCQPVALRNFDRWLTSVLERLVRKGSIVEEAAELELDVIEKLRQCIATPAKTNGGKVPTELRRATVHRIQQHIAENSNVPDSIDELCAIGEVSRRTLEYAFREIFACSPRQFIKAQKLNAARQGLLLAKHQYSSVAGIATAHGFSHMGQFAADYQRRFGERPNQTLARSASTAELKKVSLGLIS